MKKKLDIATIGLVGSLFLANGILIIIWVVTIFSAESNTKFGAGILFLISAAFEFAFWKLLKGPISRIKSESPMVAHSNGLIYAGFNLRLLAGLIDFLIFLPIVVLPYYFSSWNLIKYEIYFWSSYIYYPYIIYMVFKYSQTLGKMVVGIKVFQDDGSPPTINTAIRRASADILFGVVILGGHLYAITHIDGNFNFEEFRQAHEYISSVDPLFRIAGMACLTWYCLEYVIMFLNTRKKAIHDYLGGTVVLVNPKR